MGSASTPYPPATTVRPNWAGTLAVLAIALFYGFGLPTLNRLVPGTVAQAAGVTIELGHGVSVVTPTGWSADVPKTNPGETLALINDTSSLVATTFPWSGSEEAMIERTRRLFESTRRFHLDATPEPFRTARGVVGTTSAIYGEQADGRVWIGPLSGGNFGFAVRVRSVPGHGDEAMRDALTLVESLQIKETK
jgi:hypothetical protein